MRSPTTPRTRPQRLAGGLLALGLFGAALTACSDDDADGGSGNAADGDAWLEENCSAVIEDSVEGDYYLSGVGYAPVDDFPLYVYNSDEGEIAPAEETLDADVPVCFDLDDEVYTSSADGSGTLTVAPISWVEHPDGDLYVKVNGHGYEDQEFCTTQLESNAACVGDEDYFQLDADRSAELA